MKVLFIGGTGVISSACSELALARNIDLTLFNRGKSFRAAPVGAKAVIGDIRNTAFATQTLGKATFDVVVDWIAFTPEHIEADIDLFRNRTGQFVFISSAAAYQTPPVSLPVVESTPLCNPLWEYARQKIACEERLLKAYREENFPMTIVRPSHTYDRTLLPFHFGYTDVNRMRLGKKVIVHGDGTSLWTLTHHKDFAKGLVGLLGNSHALGEAFHITSDEWLTWNQIYEIVAAAAHCRADIVHIPSDIIARFDSRWGESLRGDKTHSMIFDNAKIKKAVPDFRADISFSQGSREIMSWYDEDPSRKAVETAADKLMDNMIAAYESSFHLPYSR